MKQNLFVLSINALFSYYVLIYGWQSNFIEFWFPSNTLCWKTLILTYWTNQEIFFDLFILLFSVVPQLFAEYFNQIQKLYNSKE